MMLLRDLWKSWTCATLSRISCCNQKIAYMNFDLLFTKDKEIQSHQGNLWRRLSKWPRRIWRAWTSGWSLVSKLMRHKREHKTESSEFAVVDVAQEFLSKSKTLRNCKSSWTIWNYALYFFLELKLCRCCNECYVRNFKGMDNIANKKELLCSICIFKLCNLMICWVGLAEGQGH